MDDCPTFLVIGNPENRRIRWFVEAAQRERVGVRVVDWLDVLACPEDLLKLPNAPELVRLDSWGESLEVERALLRRGLTVDSEFPKSSRLSAREIEALTEHGRVHAPRQAHDGVLSLLADLERILSERRAWTCLQPIAAIRTLFDKSKTHELAAQLGVRVARALPVASEPGELFATMDRLDMRQAYVKVGCSSSASCLVLVQRSPRGTSLITSLELASGRFYNSLRVRRYARPELVERVLRFVLAEGCHIEQAIDKLPYRGRHADLRLLHIRGIPGFEVLRTSQTPITNLHLGGKRGDVATYREKLSDSAWDEALAFGETLSAALGTWHIGLDIAFARDSLKAYLLEGNAFGDLLPGLEREGRSAYGWEIVAARKPS